MAKTVCKILGVAFLLVGIAGFAAPTLLGFHFGPAHNLVHILSGVIALYLGFAGSLSGAKGFCLIFGIVYLALGIFGMTMGAGPDRMLAIGPLHLGTPDHRASYSAWRHLPRWRAFYEEILAHRIAFAV